MAPRRPSLGSTRKEEASPLQPVPDWESLARAQGEVTLADIRSSSPDHLFAMEDRNSYADQNWRPILLHVVKKRGSTKPSAVRVYDLQGNPICEESGGLIDGIQQFDLFETNFKPGKFFRSPKMRRGPRDRSAARDDQLSQAAANKAAALQKWGETRENLNHVLTSERGVVDLEALVEVRGPLSLSHMWVTADTVV